MNGILNDSLKHCRSMPWSVTPQKARPLTTGHAGKQAPAPPASCVGVGTVSVLLDLCVGRFRVQRLGLGGFSLSKSFGSSS